MNDKKTFTYKGTLLPIYGGAWSDPMNACFYEVIDRVHVNSFWDMLICRDRSEGVYFALPECR